MRLYLVRHPKPLVPAGVCYGSSDIGVEGRDIGDVLCVLTASVTQDESAVEAAACVSKSSRVVSPATGLPKCLPIYSSPLQRCAGLARCLADLLGCASLLFDERLAEMHFGDWELRAWEDIPRGEVDAWAADLTLYRPGGGETVMEMAERVRAFYIDVLLRRQDAIVVCHAGTIRMLLACQENDALEDIALVAAKRPMEIRYGQVVVLDCCS